MNNIKKRKIRKFMAHPTTQLVVAVLLFAISLILIRDGKMAEWEKVVFNAFYYQPDFLAPMYWTITQLGGVGVLLAVAFIFLLIKRYALVIQMLVAGILSELLAHMGKSMVGRPRPAELLTNLISRDQFIYGPGFPSGHTSVATAVGLVLFMHMPKGYRWIAVVWIVGVMASRMYLGVHAPMDLVGGFAIGWACVSLVRHVKMTDIR